MIAFPAMLISAAERAGMKTPTFEKADDFDNDEFPHFAVFCALQLGRPMVDMNEHWDNARIVAAVPEEDIRTTTLQYYLDRGLSWAN